MTKNNKIQVVGLTDVFSDEGRKRLISKVLHKPLKSIKDITTQFKDSSSVPAYT